MREWGTLPEGELHETRIDVVVKTGVCYGFRGEYIRDIFKDEDAYLDLVLNAIRKAGDEPIYVRVEIVGLFGTAVDVFFVARRNGPSSVLAVIIDTIRREAGLLFKTLLSETKYYLFVEKPPEEVTPPGEKKPTEKPEETIPPAIMGIPVGIIILIIIILLLSRR